ncbi:MAG: hypothetical protein H0X64_14750 [Gemmatimonadaceae bacterium]|nr:hypothetical protein [Gemmatimonadaceae bacterium]
MIKVVQAGRLLEGQEGRLVWIENVIVTPPTIATSQAGRRHLRFRLAVDGGSYDSIMYAFDWSDVDRDRLATGRVHLLGFWDTFQGASSFVTKWVEEVDGPYGTTAHAPAPAHPGSPLVMIADARTSGVEKFVSSSLRMHARFSFSVPGDASTYAGIVYEGVWTSDLLDRLRSGRADLIGRWDTSEAEPYLVLERVGVE